MSSRSIGVINSLANFSIRVCLSISAACSIACISSMWSLILTMSKLRKILSKTRDARHAYSTSSRNPSKYTFVCRLAIDRSSPYSLFLYVSAIKQMTSDTASEYLNEELDHEKPDQATAWESQNPGQDHFADNTPFNG